MEEEEGEEEEEEDFGDFEDQGPFDSEEEANTFIELNGLSSVYCCCIYSK
jgi:hypothetical protein